MSSKFGAKSFEWTTRPRNPAASAAEGDKALGKLGIWQPCRYAYFKSCLNIFKLSTNTGAQDDPGVFKNCYSSVMLVPDLHVPGTAGRPPYIEDLDLEFNFVFQKRVGKLFHIIA